MRVDRSLEKLRSLLERRGITSTASGLAAAIGLGAVMEAPAALAASISTAAVAGAVTSASTNLTLIKIMSMTKLKAGLITAVLAVGVAVPVWQETRVRQLTAENSQLLARTTQLQQSMEQSAAAVVGGEHAKELLDLRGEHQRMQSELARLRSMAGVARRAESEAAELRNQLARQQSASTNTNQVTGAMGELMRNALEQQFRGQLSRMQAKLNLTPQQAEAVRAILERQTEQMARTMQKVFGGKLDKQDMADLGQGGFNPDQEIAALLAPEQQTMYKEFKQEEAAHNARLAANGELMQIQTSLGLTSEQQDQVFSVLYDQIFRQSQGLSVAAPSSDPYGMMKSAVEQKIKACRTC